MQAVAEARVWRLAAAHHDTIAPEVSVVVPCLNEHETLGTCIQKPFDALAAAGISSDFILADNRSTDGSIEIAESLGARVLDRKLTPVSGRSD